MRAPLIHWNAVGFITGAQDGEVEYRTREEVVGVFVPTTPNPTTGFIVLVPQDQVIKLDMSVADGIKFIMSLGAVAPDFAPPELTAGAVRAAVVGNPAIVGNDGREKAISIPTLQTDPVGTRQST